MLSTNTPNEDRLKIRRAFYITRDPVRKARVWLEIVLLVIGLVLLLAVGIEEVISYSSSRASLEMFHASDRSGHYNLIDQSDRGLPDSEPVAHIERSLFSTTAATPLAVLDISRLQLVAPVFDGTDDRTLRRGLGRISGTALPGQPGNIGIAGHRDSFFRKLKEIRRGDTVQLSTLKATDTYVVDQITIVDPGAVEVLQPRSIPSLTLVTCYPFHYIGGAPRRFVVSASLIPTKRPDGRSNLIAP